MTRTLGDAAEQGENLQVVSILLDPYVWETLVSRGLSRVTAIEIAVTWAKSWIEERR